LREAAPWIQHRDTIQTLSSLSPMLSGKSINFRAVEDDQGADQALLDNA
jgi:hypothetical protein